MEWTNIPFNTDHYELNISHDKAMDAVNHWGYGTYETYCYIKNDGIDVYQGYATFVVDALWSDHLKGTWSLTDGGETFSCDISIDGRTDVISLYNLSENFPTGDSYEVTVNVLPVMSIGQIDGRVIPIDNSTITLNSDGQLRADTTTIATHTYVDNAIETAIGNAIGGSY